jgi:hypothetical protein
MSYYSSFVFTCICFTFVVGCGSRVIVQLFVYFVNFSNSYFLMLMDLKKILVIGCALLCSHGTMHSQPLCFLSSRMYSV